MTHSLELPSIQIPIVLCVNVVDCFCTIKPSKVCRLIHCNVEENEHRHKEASLCKVLSLKTFHHDVLQTFY